jgi:hypothetical protein
LIPDGRQPSHRGLKWNGRKDQGLYYQGDSPRQLPAAYLQILPLPCTFWKIWHVLRASDDSLTFESSGFYEGYDLMIRRHDMNSLRFPFFLANNCVFKEVRMCGALEGI